MNWHTFTQKIAIVFALALTSTLGLAQEEKAFNAGETIIHHISDSHEWHFATIGHTHITLPLPVILYTENGLDIFLSSEFHHAQEQEIEYHGKMEKAQVLQRGENTYVMVHDKIHLANHGKLIDFSITKNVASMFLSVALLLGIFLSIGKSYKTQGVSSAPKGLQSFFEPIVVFVRDEIAKPNIGPKHERYVPYLLTIFFFIWFNNLLGLMPGGANLTGNISVTLTLAGLTLLITLFTSNKNYWKHIFATPGVPVYLLPIMIPVELLGIFTKPFSLMVRLFANITAGHIIILSLLSLIFIFKSFFVAPVSIAFAVAMNCLELFVALLQAYVFTLLTSMYFGSAIEEHHHDHDEEHHHHDKPEVHHA
jgi:F-type H+-transporting ATPase subunit a